MTPIVATPSWLNPAGTTTNPALLQCRGDAIEVVYGASPLAVPGASEVGILMRDEDVLPIPAAQEYRVRSVGTGLASYIIMEQG